MVGRTITWTSLGGLKRKRNVVEDKSDNLGIVKRLRRFCGRRDPEPMCIEEDFLAKGSNIGDFSAKESDIRGEKKSSSWGYRGYQEEEGGGLGA